MRNLDFLKGESVQGKILFIVKSTVSFFTSGIKKQPMPRLKKGKSGPVKNKVLASRDELMVHAFFKIRKQIYTNTALRVRWSTPTSL